MPYKQWYEDLGEIKRKCRGGQRFEDPEFPAIDSKVFKKRVLPGGQSFEWLRPQVSERSISQVQLFAHLTLGYFPTFCVDLRKRFLFVTSNRTLYYSVKLKYMGGHAKCVRNLHSEWCKLTPKPSLRKFVALIASFVFVPVNMKACS